MFAIVQAIGWPIWPLIIASIVALALIIERAVSLRREKVLPATLLKDVLSLHSRRQITPEIIVKLESSSPLGRVLAAGLRNVRAPRAIAGAAVANAGGHVSHDLSRYLSLLGSIGSVAPLLGLLGTVIGMIEVFQQISLVGVGKADALAGGISKALNTTAFGLSVAIPSLVAFRYYESRVDRFVLEIEQHALRFVELLKGERG